MSEDTTETEEEEPIKPEYGILGCGSVGKMVAEYLDERNDKFFAVELDEDRVEDLRNEGYHAYRKDIRNFEELNIDFEEVKSFLILSSDPKANEKALKSIKENYPETLTIIRAFDPITKEKFTKLGADIVIHPSKVLAESVTRQLKRFKSLEKSKELKEEINSVNGKLGILVHTNPDPDAIASAQALKKICENLNTEASIVYSGEIGHQENRAFVNVLEIELFSFEEVGGVEGFEKIALLDHSIPGQNNPLPEDFEPAIVIDHHEVDKDKVKANFVDIRSDVGSTSTIMTKYLQELDISIDTELATSLLFGIRTDTLNFKRNVHTADFTASNYLYHLSDQELLTKIETPAMDAETLNILGEAIKKRRIYSSYLISNIGKANEKDALPQAADYLLKLEGVSTVVVVGLINGMIHISARTEDVRVDIGEVIREAYEDIGSAGGHARMAGAQIPVSKFGAFKNEEIKSNMIDKGITYNFLKAVGIE
ncbi:MAG: nanoRNase/pAp phosphatase hydrolyzes c-di-AMP and oligoRNAs NrnA [Candidatus Methanohalarchaeum thermophilum]|uniref:NanoRNase/pAp phosphatase hydrolyzes c-di-AMP and oligoRNAs NrnA n=1 Tax=Methanohalarchaeum thermophilum TaxID=1903181 RepID=A0A1Q6DUI8_METT1|nr:MAG: nanoRNase/pAp phosphatase hydrolyzes c-di-AMP and oligoRNAs NrnA [Candidatus Methanohalarchaeum thermophilum]